MPEGEKRVILSSDFDREQPTEQEAKEKQKEKLTTREHLNRAVLELKNLLKDLPKDSKESQRAGHTLKAVEWALGNLGKEGASSGKYRLGMKDHEGKPAKWPDGKVAVQDEGVPVDELIDLLKGRAKELNTEARKKENVQKKKKEMDELWERYRLAHDVDLKGTGGKDKVHHDKAWVYSQYQEAKKAHEAAQKAYDLGDEKGNELEDLANELYKRSETHFQAHYNHELPLKKEESDKQNVRTTHEAYLIHHDYRKTGSNDKDYKAGMDAMGKRRELKMEEEQEPPMAGPIPEQGPKPAEPEKPKKIEPEPIKPETKPIIPDSGLKPVGSSPEIRGVIVNAEAQVEFLARERANKRVNEILNSAGRLKKMWFRAWEEGYRQQLIDEERKKILGEGNNPNWLKRKLFGAQKIEATGKKNLFAGSEMEAGKKESENKAELGALAQRFSKGYIHESEGEQKKQLEDPEFNQQINGLVKEYMEGSMSDEAFEQKKDVIITAIAKKYPDSFAAGKLTADNFLEAAKEYREIYKHGNGLARIDVNLGVDLGLAKQAIKTQANIKFVDKMIAKMQKYPVLGHVFTPGAVGFGVSIGGYLFKKPLYWLGGAAGMGGLLGGMRRNFEQKRDLEMHRIERAMGNEIGDYESKNGQRKEMEKYVYEMKKASELGTQLGGLRTAFKANPNPETAAALTKLLAETEARMSLSESRQKDLISFDGESSLERGRLYLMKELAEAKVGLDKKGFASNITSTQEYRDSMATLGGSMDKLDKSEKYKRWKENAKAAAVGAVTGLVVGGLAQQAAAEIGDRVSWLSWMRPGGKATGAERLYHYINGDMPTMPSGAGMFEVLGAGGAHGTVKIDGSTELIQNRSTGLWSLVEKTDHSKILAEMDIDPATGQLTPILGKHDSSLIHFSSRTTGGGHRSISEWVDSAKGSLPKGASLQEMHTESFYDNDTVAPKFDFNELRFYMHADAHGNITMDASKIQEYLENDLHEQVSGSKHGGKALDMLNAFKNGEIKIAIAPDPDHPSEMFTLEPDPATGKYVLPATGNLAKMFGVDGSGNVTYKGKGFMGMIENPKDTQVARWINSIRGNGEEIDTGTGKQIVNEIIRKQPKDWWMPWFGVFRRKALEQLKDKKKKTGEEQGPKQGGGKKDGTEHDEGRKNEILDKQGKKIDTITIFEDGEKEEDLQKKLAGKKFKKSVKVDTRGQKIETHDRKDYGKDYPEKFPFKSEKEMAQILSDQIKATGHIFARGGDAETLKKLDEAGRLKFLEEAIKNSRKGMEMMDGKIAPPEEVTQLVEFVIGEVSKEFDKYSKDSKDGRSEMPDASKIHVVGVYEFQAQSNGQDALGLCYYQSGEIFVNYELLKNISKDNNELIRGLKRTIAHELAHGAAAANYWTYESDSGDSDETHIQRRTGLVNIRRQNKGLVKERGRALNEAVTETLAKNITNQIYQKEGVKPPESRYEPYQAERDVLNLMELKFGIPFERFAEAVVNRKALRKLAELMDGKSKEGHEFERPQFMSLIMSVMDFEHKNNCFDYTKTKQLIKGEKGVVISREMKLSFPQFLLDEKGDIKKGKLGKPGLLEKYDLVDMEAESKKLPIAA